MNPIEIIADADTPEHVLTAVARMIERDREQKRIRNAAAVADYHHRTRKLTDAEIWAQDDRYIARRIAIAYHNGKV